MVTEIQLTQGKVALVDDEDAEWLGRWKWYACRTQKAKFTATRARSGDEGRGIIYMSREILGLTVGDGLEADHENHDTLDNRRANLRVLTPAANKENQPSRGGTSRYVGVTWDVKRSLWRAQIQARKRGINLGRYRTEDEAAMARDRYVIDNNTGHALNFNGGLTR